MKGRGVSTTTKPAPSIVLDTAATPASDILFAAGRFPNLDGMRRRIRDFDWASTDLGAVENWSQTLVTAVDLCLGSRMCSCIYWGDAHVIVYNDAYASILGTKHPWALGRTVAEVWPEIIDVIGPLMEQTLASGDTTGGDDVAIFLNRSGYVEEFYCSFSYSPIVDTEGDIKAVFATLPETSQRVIGERRLRTLQSLGAEIREARHPEEALQITAQVFARNNCDIPFAALYSWHEDDAFAELVATVNTREGSPLGPKKIDLEGRTPLANLFAKARAHAHARLTISAEYEPIPLGAWQIPAKELLAVALLPHDESAPRGLMLIGLNPHKALDETYLSFFNMAADQITRSLASAFTHEQEAARLDELQQRARSAQAAERLRIARDLHDTLLQSIQGLRFLLEAAIERNDAGDKSARNLFKNALSAAAHAIDEGREVLSLLRSTTSPSDSIEASLVNLWVEVGGDTAIAFDVEQDGESREFIGSVWVEIFSFCREALTNAVRHSQASTIGLKIEFSDPVKVWVTDNGCGIEENLLIEGRAGHYGLTGMRERAEAIGGHLVVDTDQGMGTQVCLNIPHACAFAREAQSST